MVARSMWGVFIVIFPRWRCTNTPGVVLPQQLYSSGWRVDLRLLCHGAAGAGLSLLLGHKLRAVSGLPGEMGSGGTLAEEGSESVEQVHARGERSPGSSPTHDPQPLPAQTQPQRGEPQPHAPALQHIHRMVSLSHDGCQPAVQHTCVF